MSRNRNRNTLYRQVQRVYDQDKLARICTLSEHKFGRAFGMETVSVAQRWPHDYYHFKDNGSRVLAVAHLDTVVAKDHRTPRFRDTTFGPMVLSGALDDRLGAYVILNMLPRLGVNCDWLFTVGEESGQSTAGLFDPGKKEYDHIIEFDRGGMDVVMYQYEDEATRAAVRASGAVVGDGIFSDIGCLEHLGVKAFNWGVGYRGDYHSERGYAFLRETFAMVAKYLRFHEQNAGIVMPHEPEWPDYLITEDSELTCEICGDERDSVDPDICSACGSCQLCWQHKDDCLCYHGRPALSKAAEWDY